MSVNMLKNTPEKKRVSVEIYESDYYKLQEIALKNDRSVVAQLRRMVQTALDNYAETV